MKIYEELQVGGGNGFIGAPSGKTDMPTMMNAETIQNNCIRCRYA